MKQVITDHIFTGRTSYSRAWPRTATRRKSCDSCTTYENIGWTSDKGPYINWESKWNCSTTKNSNEEKKLWVLQHMKSSFATSLPNPSDTGLYIEQLHSGTNLFIFVEKKNLNCVAAENTQSPMKEHEKYSIIFVSCPVWSNVFHMICLKLPKFAEVEKLPKIWWYPTPPARPQSLQY